MDRLDELRRVIESREVDQYLRRSQEECLQWAVAEIERLRLACAGASGTIMGMTHRWLPPNGEHWDNALKKAESLSRIADGEADNA